MKRIQADKMFRAFADETRLRILHLLSSQKELCVCDLIDALGVGQSKVSRHLAYLKRCGFVADRKQGLWRYYTLAKPKSSFHHKLAGCLRECFREVPSLRRDRRRLNSTKSACRS